MHTILVTGGAGYIGSHACKALARRGFQPLTVDNLSTGHREAVRWGPLEQGDIRDEAFLDQVFRRHAPIGVMHFAAMSLVGVSVTAPADYYDNNVVGSLRLAAAACRHGVQRLVFSSTCAVYGLPARVPIDETLPHCPINPYGATKSAVERLLADFGVYGLRSTALRYFNAAGADADGEIGEAHNPETHLIPLAFDAVLGRRDGLQVFGDDYETADGTCVRDYIHVEDLIEAHLLALERLDRQAPGCEAFNLGVGTGYSVRQVIDCVERVTGRPLPHRIAPRRAGDPPVLVAAADKARQELGWSATARSDLDAIIATAWRWHQRMVDAKPS